MIFLQHSPKETNSQTRHKNKKDQFDGGINKSLAVPNESQNISQNMLEQVEETMQMAIKLSSLPVSDELKVFNSIQELNWAWLFFSLKQNTWTQFECLNCMMLESKYWLWKKDPTVSFQILVENVSCTIKFDKMVAVAKDTLGDITTFKIKRTEKNFRQRPNAEERFQGS